ncbi:hypothetical protein DB345_06200 [Spartobacteria bacterium LR76]|nr:hypothetical protein DB345_06200 [Spartobacteria bacterium LR76]
MGDGEPEELESRAPEGKDLAFLCRELNERNAQYVIVGGFAIIAAGYARTTVDIDILIGNSVENEARVFDALAKLPDGCVRELQPGDVGAYMVVRVADEIVVDLMASASGIGYDEASKDIVWRELAGVQIPFASPALLWRMKRVTGRDKDAGDLSFLRQWFASQGQAPPP